MEGVLERVVDERRDTDTTFGTGIVLDCSGERVISFGMTMRSFDEARGFLAPLNPFYIHVNIFFE